MQHQLNCSKYLLWLVVAVIVSSPFLSFSLILMDINIQNCSNQAISEPKLCSSQLSEIGEVTSCWKCPSSEDWPVRKVRQLSLRQLAKVPAPSKEESFLFGSYHLAGLHVKPEGEIANSEYEESWGKC